MALTVDFYLLSEPSLEMCLRDVCRLVEQHYQDKQMIYIHTNSHAITQQLDDLLWTFRDVSFLPHRSITSKLDFQAPILLGDVDDLNVSGDLLINLAEEIPNFYKNFKRILEIVPFDEQTKEKARGKYKYYKRQGYVLVTHTLA